MSDGVTQELAKFASKTTFADLPQDVVHHTKRLICEDIACTLGGYTTERGLIARNLAKSLGGNPQATILGSGEKTSMVNAAFVNTNMGFAHDFDDVWMMDGHPGIFMIFAMLPVAEFTGASGKDLISAMTVGYDIAVRINDACGHFLKVEGGKLRAQPVSGMSWIIFGGAAGAGKILGLDEKGMTDAMGLAGMLAPVPTLNKWPEPLEPEPLSKAEFGWFGQGAITAALLAHRGLTAPNAILDGKVGFWRMQGSPTCDFDFMVDKLGQTWRIVEATHKPWPSCRMTHHPLTAFTRALKSNAIKADEIEKAVVKGSLMFHPMFHVKHPPNWINSQYSIGHLFANAAYDVTPGPKWHDPSRLDDPKIKEFREKVFIQLSEETLKSVAEQISTGIPQHITKVPTTVEITAQGGKLFSETVEYAKGDPWDGEFAMSDDELREKFRANAIEVLPFSTSWKEKIEKALEMIFKLEEVEDINELTELLSP